MKQGCSVHPFRPGGARVPASGSSVPSHALHGIPASITATSSGMPPEWGPYALDIEGRDIPQPVSSGRSSTCATSPARPHSRSTTARPRDGSLQSEDLSEGTPHGCIKGRACSSHVGVCACAPRVPDGQTLGHHGGSFLAGHHSRADILNQALRLIDSHGIGAPYSRPARSAARRAEGDW